MSWLFKSFLISHDDHDDDYDEISAESQSNSSSSSPSRMLQGIRNDLAEIGGGLRDGFSILSVNSKKAVGEISRLASNLLPIQRDDEEDEFITDTPGISDEVLSFAAEISKRPEYWTNFPLALDYTDSVMSHIQRMHTATVEQLIPNISALKKQLQCYMSNELFWFIYFILVLPRFNEDDFELLVTTQIIETRNLLVEKCQRKEESQVNSDDTPDYNLQCGTQNGNMHSLEKANSTRSTEGGNGLEIQEGDEENAGLRPKMEAKERDGGLEGSNPFSDIEDGWTNLSGRFCVINPPRTSSSTESSDWVKLHENLVSKLDQPMTGKQDRDSEAEDFSDWSNMDGFY